MPALIPSIWVGMKRTVFWRGILNEYGPRFAILYGSKIINFSQACTPSLRKSQNVNQNQTNLLHQTPSHRQKPNHSPT